MLNNFNYKLKTKSQKKLNNKLKSKYIKFNILYLIIFFINISIININTYAINKNNIKNNYQIELVIFKYNNTDAIFKENWELKDLDIPKNAIKIQDYLSENHLKYKYVYNNINNNSRYKVISHIGWTVAKEDAEPNKPIYFQAGKTYNYNYEYAEDNNINQADKKPDDTYDNDNNNKLAQTSEISGIIKFKQKKYLHADINILLNQPVLLNTNPNQKQPFTVIKDLDKFFTENNNSAAENLILQTFIISENRKLVNKTLNYLDHPAFGVVLVVTEV